jgi:hypothetical protein
MTLGQCQPEAGALVPLKERLGPGHGYVAVQILGVTATGLDFFASDVAADDNESHVRWFRAGEVLPIDPKKRLFIGVRQHNVPPGDGAVDPDNDDNLIWMRLFERGEHIPSSSDRVWMPQDRAHNIDYFSSTPLAIGADVVLLEAWNVRHLLDLPLYCVLQLSGGWRTTPGSNIQFPGELVLETPSLDDNGIGGGLVHVFPGDWGEAYIRFPLPPVWKTKWKSGDPVAPWRLLVRNPTGNVDTISVAVRGAVVVGDVGHEAVYQAMAGNGSEPANTNRHPVAFTIPAQSGPGKVGLAVQNRDSTRFITYETYSYVDTLHGGPYHIPVIAGTTIAPAAQAKVSDSVYGRHFFTDFYYVIIPGVPIQWGISVQAASA